MWEQYRKTLLGMQLVIVLMTFAAYKLLYGSLIPTATLFVVMQVAGVAGAYWATRIKQRMERFR